MRKLSTLLLMMTLASCANLAKKEDAGCTCVPDSLAESKVTRLSLGTDKLIDIAFEPSHMGVFIGNPAVLAVTVLKAGPKIQLLVKPLKSGSTSVTIMNSTGEMKFSQQFEVTRVDLLDLSRQLLELLKEVPAAKVRIMNDHVVVDGELPSTAELGRVVAITTDRRYADSVLNLTRLSPQFFADLAAKAGEEIKKEAPNVTVRTVNNQLWLEGTARTTDQANRAARIASLLIPQALPADPLTKLPDAETIPPRPMVQNFIKIEK